MMNIVVIGAAGKTGKLVVEQVLGAGHRVTAFVHDPGHYAAPGGVRVVTGDAKSVADLRPAIRDQDAVIDTIGGKTPFLKTDLEQSVARAVLDAMKLERVSRLLVVSALGVGDSRAQGTFMYDHLLLPTFLRGSTADKEQMEQLVRDSGVRFVLVRPAILTDQPATGNVRVVIGTEKAHKITRADVAQFLVEQLDSDRYLGAAVTIANE